jgi:hypothetical protein
MEAWCCPVWTPHPVREGMGIFLSDASRKFEYMPSPQLQRLIGRTDTRRKASCGPLQKVLGYRLLVNVTGSALAP